MNHTHSRGRIRRAAGGVALATAAAGTLVVGVPAAQAAPASSFKVISHSGDRDATPENTLPAFRSAITKGTDLIELDVQYSSDNIPIVMHDSTISRTTNCSGKVSAHTHAQMAKCDAGSWFSANFKGTRIPTLWMALREIHARSNSVQVILHMKVTPNTTQVKQTMGRVRSTGMINRAIVMGSNSTVLSRMKAGGAKYVAFIFNNASGWKQNYKILVPYETAVTSRLVSAAHKRGQVVWPVESHPLELQSLLSLPAVDGALVNHLSALVNLLKSGSATSTREVTTKDQVVRTSAPDSAEDEMTRP